MLFRLPVKYFLIEKFAVYSLRVGAGNGAVPKQSMVAALGILCVFLGSRASSSMWALSGAQLLFC